MSKRTIVRRPVNSRKKTTPKRKQGSQNLDTEPAASQQMYVISERWQSDLVFFYDELHFLRKLIDKYLMWLIDDDNIENARRLGSDLAKLEKRRYSILQRLDQHRRRLANLVENPFSHDDHECTDEHTELEALVAGFAKDFRQTKKAVFHLTEHVIDSEKARRIFNGG